VSELRIDGDRDDRHGALGRELLAVHEMRGHVERVASRGESAGLTSMALTHPE